ncbi:hypothetical protein FJQ54_10340 [Sandaracinobacter neustonicus]|jgi:hypothetical protein|uniref:Uncharacterized protein n=1 Tax=Sandaracinobacter neustonicus TaxID=1715348 RepID=A0A501XJB2_9SPHN|nr:hypothetical protein FJQ54_10340 [Sandaracinobacter neustonicus]
MLKRKLGAKEALPMANDHSAGVHDDCNAPNAQRLSSALGLTATFVIELVVATVLTLLVLPAI